MATTIEVKGTVYTDEVGTRLLITDDMSFTVIDIVKLLRDNLRRGAKVRILIEKDLND